MSQGELRRVREDLENLKRLAGTELHFDHPDVLWHAAVGATGLPLLLWYAYGPIDWLRCLGFLPLAVVSLACAVWAHQRAQEIGISTARKRDYRLYPLVGVWVVALVIFLNYARWIGVPARYPAAGIAFFVGIVCASWPLLDRTRLNALGAAIPLIALGLALPFLDEPRPVGIAIAVCLLVTYSTVAGIMVWQLRQYEGRDVTAG